MGKADGSWYSKQDLWIYIPDVNTEEKETPSEPENPGTIPEDGKYTTTVTSSASMFKVVDAELNVKNGKITALITLSGVGYDYLYVGSAEDAAKKTESEWIKYCGSKTYTETESGSQKEGRQYEIPVAALDQPISVAAHSARLDKWYDRTLTFSAADLKKVSDGSGSDKTNPTSPTNPTNPTNPTTSSNPSSGNSDQESRYSSDTSGSTGKVNNSTTLADGVYTPDRFSWSGGSGRVNITCNKVTVSGGQAYATIVFSSSSYQYVKANGNIYYGTVGAGSTTFVIPVELNKNNQIIGMTVKMSNAHEVAYSIFVYLAAAGQGGTSAGNLSSTSLSKEAPEIAGLQYESETQTQYAELFKIYHYQDNITLLEVDISKYTASEDEDSASEETENTEAESNETEDTEVTTDTQEGETTAESQEEITAELYQSKIVRYLIVPEGTDVPAGLDKEMIVVNLPAEDAYVSEAESLEKMEDLDLLEQIGATGVKKDQCSIKSLQKAMENKDVLFAGDYEDLDYKKLVKAKADLAILTGEILPQKEESTSDEKDSDEKSSEKLSTEEQKERYQELTERLATLKIPVVFDRSEDEKTDLAKAEWIKVYGALFGKQDEADKLFEQVEQEAKAAENNQ